MYKLGENCEYADMTSDMIRDRIVVDIHDTKLTASSDLTLAKTKQMVRQGANSSKPSKECDQKDIWKRCMEETPPRGQSHALEGKTAAGDTNSGLHKVTPLGTISCLGGNLLKVQGERTL